MLRKTFIALVAMFALAGCVTAEAEYGYRPPVSAAPAVYRPPPGPSIYDTAPRAPLHSELFACNGGGGSNIGQIGYRGEAALYTPYIDTPAGPLLRNPTEIACLSSGFGWRGALDAGRQHNGLDLANREGGFIFAAGEGRIVSADYRGGYGNTVEIDHGAGVRTLYAHMSEINQRLYRGVHVSAGEAIGRMGMTGNATGVHLHYEVWIDGLLVDPLHYGRPPVYVSMPSPDPPFLPAEDGAATEHVNSVDDATTDYPPPITLEPPDAAVDKPTY